MKRSPVVANYFYPGDRITLQSMLEEMVEPSEEKIPARGIVVPHAGYVYSGDVAGKVYGSIESPDLAIILGPNHTGLGSRASLYEGEAFLTPLGEARINRELANLILERCSFLEFDNLAHLREHSLEVQVPFLQFLNPQIEIIPLCLMELSLTEIDALGRAIGSSIAEFEENTDKRVLIVSSSDFSHYEPQNVAQQKDSLAIEAILELSPEKLLRVVYEKRISMCGVLAVAVNMVASMLLGAETAILVDYKTSGDITGDYSAVVGYGGLILY